MAASDFSCNFFRISQPLDLNNVMNIFEVNFVRRAPTWEGKIFVATFDAMVWSVSNVVIDELSHLHHHNL